MAEETKQNQYNTIGLGYVAPRPVVRMNLDAYTKAIDKIDQKSREAREKKSAIDAALAQVELNPSEDAWKYKYAKNIKDQIDQAAMFGDYSGALNTAIELAGKAVSSPELLGRIRASKAYKEKSDEIDKRVSSGEITALTARRWKAQNPYKYQDTYDENGNIIGGTEWKQSYNPVRIADIAQIAERAIRDAAPSVQSSASERRNAVSNAESTGVGSGKFGTLNSTDTTRGSSTQVSELTAEKIRSNFMSLYNQDEVAKQYTNQNYDDYKWLYDEADRKLKDPSLNLTAEERAQLEKDRQEGLDYITDAQGNITSPFKAMLKNIDNVLVNAAFRNVDTRSNSTNISGYGYGSAGGSGGSGNGNNSGVPDSLARRPGGWTLGGVLGLTNGADNIQAANGYIQSAAR
jgi:hypothetical protein